MPSVILVDDLLSPNERRCSQPRFGESSSDMLHQLVAFDGRRLERHDAADDISGVEFRLGEMFGAADADGFDQHGFLPAEAAAKKLISAAPAPPRAKPPRAALR